VIGALAGNHARPTGIVRRKHGAVLRPSAH